MQGDQTGDSQNKQPSYQSTKVRWKKRKNKRKIQNIGKAPQHQIHRRNFHRQPVSNSAPQSKPVEADPSWSETGPQANPERTTWIYTEKMTEEQLEQALETIAEDPNNTTIFDNNGNNYDNIKTEQIENENSERQTRRSTRIKSTNPITRLGNPVTHWYLQGTPFRR